MNKFLLLILVIVKSTILFGQSHSFDTLFVINKKQYRFQTKDINTDQVTLSVMCNSKIIKTDTLDSRGLLDIRFPDFNKDGNKDIMLTYGGKNFTNYLYLYDKKNTAFKFVEGFERFPDAIQLKANPNYYYSYQRAGCADMNWVSALFYIDNFKTIYIGHMDGKGCDFEVNVNPQVIEIYKISGNKEGNRKLFARLSYLKNITPYVFKWDYIKKFWNKNYAMFK